MEELSYVLTEDFFSWVHVRFYFYFTPAHFLLAGRWHFSFSHCRYEIFRFFFQRNSSPLFSITRSSSFSVIHVSVNITNNVEKDTTLFFFSLWKSGRPWDFLPNKTLSFIWFHTCWLSYLILVCLCADGRAVGRSGGRTVTWRPKFLVCIGYQIFLPTVLYAARASRARELRYYKLIVKLHYWRMLMTSYYLQVIGNFLTW